jgi:hypothetical protein
MKPDPVPPSGEKKSPWAEIWSACGLLGPEKRFWLFFVVRDIDNVSVIDKAEGFRSE